MRQIKNWILGGLLAVMLASTASANNYEQGKEAYDARDYATALSILKPLAEAGNADAQLTLSWMYYFGRGVPQDDARSTKWRRRALNTEDTSTPDFHKGAQAYLAGDYATALAEFYPLAEAGDTDAQYKLGNMYRHGYGVEEDDAEAEKWYRLVIEEYRRAAKAGDAAAQNFLGVMYQYGKGVERDGAIAVKWFRLAADAGHVYAQYNLGTMYDDGYGVDEDEALRAKWWRLAFEGLHRTAEAGDSQAQFILGTMHYYHGEEVSWNNWYVMQSFSHAVEVGDAAPQNNPSSKWGLGNVKEYLETEKWFRRAVAGGHAESQDWLSATRYRLGKLYLNGWSGEQDFVEAEKWYRLAGATGMSKKTLKIASMHRAAEAGDAEAQSNLGRMYFEGDVVEWSDKKAMKWFHLAAEQGDAYAQYRLGRYYYSDFGDSYGVEQDPAKAAKWYRLAAEQEHELAQGDLAKMYYLGEGVEQDLMEAEKWLHLAIEAGHYTAEHNLEVIYNKRRGVEQNGAEAAEWQDVYEGSELRPIVN